MSYQYGYLVAIFLAMAISLGIAVYAWRQRVRPGAVMFAGMMFAVAFWLFASVMVSLSQSPVQARRWVNPRYFGLTAMLAFFIVFAIQYTGHEKWLPGLRLGIIFSIPLLTQLIIETNPRHHWFLVDVRFSRDDILMGLDAVQYGPVFWAHTLYSYALVLIGIGLIVQKSIRTFNLYRMQAIFMLLGILPPLLTSVIDAFLLIPGLKHPIAPLGFAMMGLAFFWAMFQYRMLDIIPVARDVVVDSMTDSVIVLDARQNVVDVNPSAQQLLGLTPHEIIGKPVAQVFHPRGEQIEQYLSGQSAHAEIRLDIAGERHYFDLQISNLRRNHKLRQSSVLILRDITAGKQAEQKLQETLAEVRALKDQLYEQAIHDALTGLYNRHFFHETIPRELTRAVRKSYPISFVLMDIDHFKAVNDNFGHHVGDVVLKNLATTLQQSTRSSDFLFRFGGEEFLVVLPATSREDAYQYAERWRLSVQNVAVYQGAEPISITLSLGIAVFPGDGEGPEQVLSVADDALYQAKAKGRNCTVVYHAEGG